MAFKKNQIQEKLCPPPICLKAGREVVECAPPISTRKNGSQPCWVTLDFYHPRGGTRGTDRINFTNKPLSSISCLIYLPSSNFPCLRQWHPTPVLLPGKSHGWRSLVGCSPWGREESDTTEQLHFHFSLSCIGDRNGNPLQCSCLENPRDGRAWQAAVYGVAQSQTRLKRLSSSSSSSSRASLIHTQSSEPSLFTLSRAPASVKSVFYILLRLFLQHLCLAGKLQFLLSQLCSLTALDGKTGMLEGIPSL